MLERVHPLKDSSRVRVIWDCDSSREDQSLNLKSAVDLSKLLPCFDNLLPHIYRTNYRLAIHKRADQPIVEAPKPFDEKQGWIKNEEGLLEPIWSTGSIIPNNLVDVIANNSDTEEELDEIDEFEETIEICNDDNSI